MEPQNQKSRLESLLKLEKEGGYDTFTSYSIALEQVSMGKGNDALARFKDIIAQDPSYLPAYFQAGRLLESQGNELSAMHFYERAIAHGDEASDPLTWKEIKSAIEMLDDGVDRLGL